jgi:hypothetical protein
VSSSIITFGGTRFDPINPDPALLDINDIAHSLSNQCRFTGHVKYFYSVAEHSVRCLDLAYTLGGEYDDTQLLRTVLLHDASEAYLSDIARPVKHAAGFGDGYRDIEDGLQAAISERYDLIYPFPPIVHAIDNALLAAEARDLMHPEFGEFPALLSYREPIKPWSSDKAWARFRSEWLYVAYN